MNVVQKETKSTEIKTVDISELKIGNYQVWSKMNDERFASFAEDIANNGIRDLIHVDEDYVILDGHHRYEAGKIAGITEVVVKVYVGLGEEGKQEVAHKNNTLTREISRDEKITKAIELRKEGRSQRQIADWLGHPQSTIQLWLKKYSTDHDCSVEKVEGKDGKQRPSEQTTADEKQQRRDRVKELREQGAKIAEIAEEVGVALGTVHNDIKTIEKSEEEAEKQREVQKRKQKLDLLEVEASLSEEEAPKVREEEPELSPNNIVIRTRKRVNDTIVGILGCYDTASSVDEDVRESYLKQVKSLAETALLTLGGHTKDDEDAELIKVCLELLKKIEN
jgi:ParB-like chromosome segregation protein Spo0J